MIDIFTTDKDNYFKYLVKMSINQNNEHLEQEEVHITECLDDIGYSSATYEYDNADVYEFLGCFDNWCEVKEHLPEEFI